jgi:hypothetical protein
VLVDSSEVRRAYLCCDLCSVGVDVVVLCLWLVCVQVAFWKRVPLRLWVLHGSSYVALGWRSRWVVERQSAMHAVVPL